MTVPEEKKISKKQELIEFLRFAIIAAVILLPIRFFIISPFVVNGASMDPTFKNGQFLMVYRLAYHDTDPARGDIVVFHHPISNEYLIKRVIGLPGETVSIIGTSTSITTPDGITTKLDESYVAIDHAANWGSASYQLPPDEYFVMGDNRNESADSRIWGSLKRENIVGVPVIRLLPPSVFGTNPGHVSY